MFGDLSEAIARGREIAERDGVDELFINGGGEIYRAAMPLADRLYVTHVDAAPDGDTFFPQIDPAVWVGTVLPEIVPGEKDSARFVTMVYERTPCAITARSKSRLPWPKVVRAAPGFH